MTAPVPPLAAIGVVVLAVYLATVAIVYAVMPVRPATTGDSRFTTVRSVIALTVALPLTVLYVLWACGAAARSIDDADATTSTRER